MICYDKNKVSKGIDVNKQENKKSAIFVTISTF